MSTPNSPDGQPTVDSKYELTWDPLRQQEYDRVGAGVYPWDSSNYPVVLSPVQRRYAIPGSEPPLDRCGGEIRQEPAGRPLERLVAFSDGRVEWGPDIAPPRQELRMCLKAEWE